MRNEYTNTQRAAVLVEMGLNYSEEINRAMNKRDFEKVKKLTELSECIDKLLEDLDRAN